MIFFWALLNLPPSIRYNLCNIKLLAIAKSSITKSSAIELLQDFISSINKFSTAGLEVNHKGTKKKYFGDLAFALGDTLALHWLGGFLEGVGTAIKFCRSCEITFNDRANEKIKEYEPRELGRHIEQLNLIKEAPDLIKTYGVKCESALLKINGFDVCSSLLQDPMHILIEGVCNLEVKALLNYLIEDKGISLSAINKRICDFQYFILDRNDLPHNIQSKNLLKNAKLPMSAGQMMTLMHNLPFIVGDLFVAYDKHWLNFLLLHKLFNLTFAYVYDERTVKELKVTIELYLENFIQLHKNERITPKMHYLTHFPSQLENYGPLRHHSCFRFESRIGLLKRFRFNNFINLAYSVSDIKINFGQHLKKKNLKINCR